jgi:predicted PurR-regulated permease PerM
MSVWSGPARRTRLRFGANGCAHLGSDASTRSHCRNAVHHWRRFRPIRSGYRPDVSVDLSERAVPLRPAVRDNVPRALANGAAWSWRILVIAGAVAVVGFSLAKLRVVLIPVFVALVGAALLAPVVERLASRLPRLVSVWATLLAALGVAVGLGLLLWQPIRDSIDDLRSEWSGAITEVERWLSEGPLGIDPERVERISEDVGAAVDQLAAGVFAEPASAARLAVEIVGGFFLTLVLTFFFLKDGPSMWQWFLERLQPSRRSSIDRGGRAVFSALQGWIRGVAITGFVDAVLIGGALLILGVPAAIPLAIITFLASFLPVVGATAAGVLATVIALVAEGPGTAVIVAAVVLVVQQLEGDVLLPVVMYRQVALHPVVVLLALAVGAAIAGIVGAIIAVPVTAAVSAAIRAMHAESAESVLLDDAR